MKALYPDVHEYGGSVSAPEAYSDVGQPMKVTYTAPDHKPSSTTTQPGFLVAATSRAGVAEGVWDVGLGTNWSGSIVCRTEYKGDQGQNDLQTWSNYRVMQNSVTVSDGQAMAVGSGSQKNVAETQQNALIGGVRSKIRYSSEDSSGTVVGVSSVPLSVSVDKDTGNYSIGAGLPTKDGTVVAGTIRTSSCDKTKCKEYDSPLPLDPGQCGWEGKFSDPNHLTGSQIVVKSNLGFAHNGTMTWTLTWDLARQGSSQ